MQILLFHPDKETRQIIAFCLESQIGLEVCQAATFQEALDYFLEDSVIDLIITNKQPETDKLFKYLLSTSAKIPVVLVGHTPEKQTDSYPDIQVIAHLAVPEVAEKMIEVVKTHFGENLTSTYSDEYCRISTELLVRVVPLRGDIYIRLSNVKFVKMFRTGSQFSKEDFERFSEKKKVQFLYIKKTDSEEFVAKFKTDLSALVAKATPGDPALFNTVTEVQMLIHELSERLGFTKEVQELARDNIQLTIKAIGNSPKLTTVFASSILKNKNYISAHSVMLANISCSIAAQMEWPSNTTFQKLVLAALFHDFAFNDPNLAKISTKQQLEELRSPTAGSKGGMTDEQYNLVKNHPLLAAEVVKGLNEVPGDVDFVVTHHHERPDGSGFPKGLRAQHLPPLSAVFIVAHDVLDAMTQMGPEFVFGDFLKRVEPQYQVGAFKKIWKALIASEATKASSDSGGHTAA